MDISNIALMGGNQFQAEWHELIQVKLKIFNVNSSNFSATSTMAIQRDRLCCLQIFNFAGFLWKWENKCAKMKIFKYLSNPKWNATFGPGTNLSNSSPSPPKLVGMEKL